MNIHSSRRASHVLASHPFPTPCSPPRAPLILQHGIFDTSATWVLNDPDQSLAFLAAEAGWDVWLPNSRGNDFSLEHTTLDISQREYWNFTFGTMAGEVIWSGGGQGDEGVSVGRDLTCKRYLAVLFQLVCYAGPHCAIRCIAYLPSLAPS